MLDLYDPLDLLRIVVLLNSLLLHLLHRLLISLDNFYVIIGLRLWILSHSLLMRHIDWKLALDAQAVLPHEGLVLGVGDRYVSELCWIYVFEALLAHYLFVLFDARLRFGQSIINLVLKRIIAQDRLLLYDGSHCFFIDPKIAGFGLINGFAQIKHRILLQRLIIYLFIIILKR